MHLPLEPLQLLVVLLFFAAVIPVVRGQAANMAGGRPPHEVEHELCDIGTVFGKLLDIKSNDQCKAGCAQGSGVCPEDWYPSAS